MLFINNENVFQYFENKFDQFTPTQKRFIRYLLNNKFEVPFLPAYEIAERINANSSTLVRFAKELGYKGYPEMQKDLGKLVIEEVRYSGQLEKAKKYNKPEENNIVKLSFKKSYESIAKMMENIKEEDIKKFSKIIFEARKKIIIANRGTFSVGHFLYFELRKIIPDVILLSNFDDGCYDLFEDFSENDLVIAICFPRYTKITIDLARYAVKQNIKLISITDSRISPLFPISVFCLLTEANSATFHNSTVTLMAISDAIIASVFDSNRHIAIKRLEREEKILMDKNVHFL
jgi:DNA-binding MurR/RpiR family transcriptional regulator